jgi:tetratricopeptide (TPR) repeat protein
MSVAESSDGSARRRDWTSDFAAVRAWVRARRVLLCTYGLSLVVAGSALGLGGAIPLIALAVGALGIFVLLLTAAETAPNIAWIPLALAFYSALQAMPLPPTLVAALSPHAYSIWERAAFAGATGWVPLSLDPAASSLEAFKWASYAAALATATWIGRRGGQAPALYILFGSALAVTLVWAVHAYAQLDSLYGFYHPRFADRQEPSPILNRNNLAGYLLLGLFAGIGLMVREESPLRRNLIRGGVVLLLTATLLTRSTGGTAALGFGIALFVLFGRRKWRRHPRRLAAVAGVFAAAVLVAALITPPEKWLDLAKFSEKIQLARWSLPLLRDFAWTGTGRGAFETVFPAYRQGTLAAMPNRVVFTHPENIVVQWVAEWGVPVTLAAVVAFFVLGLRAGRRRRISLSSMALSAGMLALLAQNLVDLGLELPALGLAFSVALGTLASAPERSPATVVAAEESIRRAGPALRRLVCFVAGVAVLGVIHFGWRLAFQDRDRAYAWLEAVRKDNGDEFFERVRRLMNARPAEPYFPLVAAQASQRLGVSAMPWVARALERDPSRGETYLVLALELARHGQRIQALESLRHGLEWDGTVLARGVRLARAISSDADELKRAAPAGPEGIRYLLSAGNKGAFSLRWALVQRALERDAKNPEVISAEGHLIVEGLKDDAWECAAERAPHCVERLGAVSRALLEKDAHSLDGLILRAELRAHNGELRDAISELTAECGQTQSPANCLRTALGLAVRTRDREVVDATATIYVRVACTGSRECARAEAITGESFMRIGANAQATEHLQHAAETEPSAALWAKTAQAARLAGLTVRARAAARKAQRLGSPESSEH